MQRGAGGRELDGAIGEQSGGLLAVPMHLRVGEQKGVGGLGGTLAALMRALFSMAGAHPPDSTQADALTPGRQPLLVLLYCCRDAGLPLAPLLAAKAGAVLCNEARLFRMTCRELRLRKTD